MLWKSSVHQEGERLVLLNFFANILDMVILSDFNLIFQCIKDINKYDILEPKCSWASPNQESERRSLEEDSEDFILSPPRIPEFWCHVNFSLPLFFYMSHC